MTPYQPIQTPVSEPDTVSETVSGGVWFPAVRTGTGSEVSTRRLADGLAARGVRTEIAWLPLRAEYAPWTVRIPRPPEWATVVQTNTWLHPRFLPDRLSVVATLRHSAHRAELDRYKGLLRRLYHRHWIRPLERGVLRRADAVVAVSQFVADAARTTLLDCPMRVIYNGVDIKSFCPPEERAPHVPFRLLYVGKWGPLKGVDMLAPIMRALGDNFELHYTGGCAAERDRPNMPPNAHDLGRLNGQDAVIAAMQSADAFLFPSRSEGLPLSVLEAMACGLPTIATRGSSLVEIIRDAENGFLCVQDDVQAFADASRALARDASRYGTMSTAAREHVSREFSIAKMLDAYVDLYDGLFQSRMDG